MPAVDSVSNISSSGVGPFTLSHTCAGTNRLLRVNVMHYDSSDDVSGVTYNGVAMTAVPSGDATNGQYWLSTFYLIAPDTGTHDVIVTVTGNVFDIGITAVSYTDVHQSVPLGTAVTATGTSTAPSVTVSSASDELVDDGLIIVNSGSLTVDTGQTQRVNTTTSNAFIKYATSTESGAASTVMSWTNGTSQAWVIMAVPIKPVGGGGGSSIIPIRAYYRRRRAA